jgi:integrase
MNSGTGLIAPLVQSFFTDHLVRQRRASPQTVASYRDTFRLLLQHLSQATGRKPADLTLDDLRAKAIMRFLDGIERDRGNSVQTRNARLAAIRSFFRLVTVRGHQKTRSRYRDRASSPTKGSTGEQGPRCEPGSPYPTQRSPRPCQELGLDAETRRRGGRGGEDS